MSVFPIGVFPRFIADHITELTRTLNFHQDFTSAAVMFAVSTIVGNSYKLKVKNGWNATPIFWLACVGFPGTIKTHPIKSILKPLNQLDIESKRQYDSEMAHYDPDAIPRQKKPKFKQLLISDYTLEALHSIHDINKRGIGLYKDELKGFLNDMNKYRKGSDEEFWLESFNNGSYIVNRVTKEPILIVDICINLIGTIQHDVLAKVISEYAGNGLIDRFLFTAPEDKVYNLTADEISDEHAQKWEDFIRLLHTSFRYIDHDSTQYVPLDKDAFKDYQRIDSEFVRLQNNENTSQEIKNYLSKMKTYVPRFALLISIMDCVTTNKPIVVKYKHMVKAGLLADYFIETATQTFSFNKEQSEIKDIVQTMKSFSTDEKIIKLHLKGFKQSELARFFNKSQGSISKLLKKGL